jgi:serine/threonine-protein kinase
MDADPTVSAHPFVAAEGNSPTAPFVFGSTVGRFVIRERLGTGGMGEVYRAEDTQLKRTVAIKRLVGAHDPNPTSRLLKEAQRASALNHPGIASVYDVFEMGNELLLVMEFVDGMTLRERMKRPLSVADFCAIAVQCTDALAAAHARGIVHGDLKPANIMLTRGGEVKICDFGLARRVPSSVGAAETTTTTQHGIAGTPAYLAPEVVLEQSADERADIFSLGVVFYQMLALRNPFAADGLMATLDRVLHESPESLDRVNPHVPGRLARTIHRMLEKDPHERTASVADVGRALSVIGTQYARIERQRRLVRRVKTWAAVAAVVVTAVVVAPRLANPPAAAPLPQSINLVVLPFTASGTAGERQSFIEGLTDSLNAELSRLTTNRPSFQVVTGADRRRLREATTPLAARRQFGANVVLRGSLEYSGQSVDVATALIDTTTGQTLRSDSFTISDSDRIAVQTRVLEAATRMMGIDLTERERLRISAATTGPRARDLYLSGRGYLLDWDRLEKVDNAIRLFQSAVQSDAKYALAYAGLGQAYWRKFDLTRDGRLVDLARGACVNALAGDGDNLAEAHICQAMVWNGTGEPERAAEAYRRALDLEPTNDVAFVGLATAYEDLREHQKAEETYLRAIRERPSYWGAYNNLGVYYYRTSRPAEALERFQEVVKLAPDSFRGHNNVGGALYALGRTKEAIEAFTTSRSIRPNFTASSNLGTIYYFEEQYTQAADYFDEALKIERGRFDVWGNYAHTLDLLGRTQEAQKAFGEARRLVLEELSVNPNDASLYVELADHHAALGDVNEAKRALSIALKHAPDDATTQFRIAVLYEYRLKARNEAFTWLTRAVEGGYPWHEIDRAPELRGLRTDPRFPGLRKLNGSQ